MFVPGILVFLGLLLFWVIEFCLTGGSRRAKTLRAVGLACATIAFFSLIELTIRTLQFEGFPNTDSVHKNKLYYHATEATVMRLQITYLACLVALPLTLLGAIRCLTAATRERQPIKDAR